jgi:hypothetical protein
MGDGDNGRETMDNGQEAKKNDGSVSGWEKGYESWLRANLYRERTGEEAAFKFSNY